MRGMKHIPVDREAGAAAYRSAVTVLRQGELVGVFPETTISRSFELLPFKSGAVRMSVSGKAPVLPVVIWGSQRVWTAGHRRAIAPHRIPVTIDVLPPITVERGDDPEVATEALHATMERALHAAQERYPVTPKDAERRVVAAGPPRGYGPDARGGRGHRGRPSRCPSGGTQGGRGGRAQARRAAGTSVVRRWRRKGADSRSLSAPVGLRVMAKEPKPAKTGRVAQLRQAYTMTKPNDPMLPWILIAVVFVVVFAVFLVLGFFILATPGPSASSVS